MTPPEDAVEWEVDVDDSVPLFALAYVFPSVLGGVVVLGCGLLAWLVATAALAGEFRVAVGWVVLATIALLSRRYVPALLDGAVRTPFYRRYSRRGLLAGSLLGAVALLGSARLHPAGPYALFVASCVPLVLTAGFPTSGHAAPSAGTLVVDGTEVPLGGIRSFRSVAVGSVAVCVLSYARGAPTAPRVAVVPRECVGPLAELIEAVPVSADAVSSTVGRAERVVAALFGLGMVAVGPILWLAMPPGGGRAIALYAGATFGLFGGLLLWYAYSA